MADLLHRAFAADLEIRTSDGIDGRTICGIACPYGEESEVADFPGGPRYREQFAHGSFSRTIRERGSRVKALAMHQRQTLPIGRATLLREDTRGLYAELRISRTDLGDQVLELVRDGALDGLSVGFRPVDGGDVWTKNRVTRHEVALREISIVDEPAYASALISAVRAAAPHSLSVELGRRRLHLLKIRTF